MTARGSRRTLAPALPSVPVQATDSRTRPRRSSSPLSVALLLSAVASWTGNCLDAVPEPSKGNRCHGRLVVSPHGNPAPALATPPCRVAAGCRARAAKACAARLRLLACLAVGAPGQAVSIRLFVVYECARVLVQGSPAYRVCTARPHEHDYSLPVIHCECRKHCARYPGLVLFCSPRRLRPDVGGRVNGPQSLRASHKTPSFCFSMANKRAPCSQRRKKGQKEGQKKSEPVAARHHVRPALPANCCTCLLGTPDPLGGDVRMKLSNHMEGGALCAELPHLWQSRTAVSVRSTRMRLQPAP